MYLVTVGIARYSDVLLPRHVSVSDERDGSWLLCCVLGETKWTVHSSYEF
jgi:hypothetical protein